MFLLALFQTGDGHLGRRFQHGHSPMLSVVHQLQNATGADLIFSSQRQWRLVYWFAVATLHRNGIRLNEGRGMKKVRHHLTKVGADCEGQEDTEVAPKVL